MTEPIASMTIGKWRRPGLLEPLGWVQARLIKAIEIEPRMIGLLFDLDHARMHLMALALAKKTILNLSLGHRPVGIARALHHLPPKAYRRKLLLAVKVPTHNGRHYRNSDQRHY